MPTHIFVRLGEWNDVIKWNRKSADAALKRPAGEYVSHHYPHAIDYLAYAYLQQAQDEKAHAVLDQLQSKEPYQQTFVSAFHLAATPARYLVELRKWEEAASLAVRNPATFPWERFAAAEAMTHFARGLGAARSGDGAAARKAVAKLQMLREAETAKGESYWATQVEIKRLAVEAWAALADGAQEEALDLMAQSTKLEASTEKHPVTPGALQPAGELLGDMLLELKQPDAALGAYQQSLEKWPRRFNSLLGAARAADRAGKRKVAREYYDELIGLAGESTARQGIAEARTYTGSH
jgi:tetratricopeptide (TPR) repeat protein